MSEQNKKILFAVFFVLFTLGMGYGLYLMYTRSIAGPGTETEQTTEATSTDAFGALPASGIGGARPSAGSQGQGGELPGAGGIGTGEDQAQTQTTGETGTTLLYDGVTQNVSAAPGSSTSARYYNPNDGRFYKINLDGSSSPLGQKQFFNVQDVSWGNMSDKAVLEFPDGSNVYYNFTEQQQVPLPKHWEDFQFSANDDRMVAKSVGTDPENRFLVVSKPDGSEAKAIATLGDNQDKVHSAWTPNGQVVAYSMTGEAQSNGRQEIYLIGQNKENYKSLVVSGRNFVPLWSPSGRNLVYSVVSPDSDEKPILWVASGEPGSIGANKRKINLYTWADKCTWADDAILYCAVPRDLPEFAGIDRSSFLTLPDEVYEVNLRTNASTKITSPTQLRPMQNITLSGDRTKLLFTDATNGKLYSYDIPPR